MAKTIRSKYLILIQFYFLCFYSIAQSTEDQKDSLDEILDSTINRLINEGHKENMFPGISAVLYQNDSTQYYNLGQAKIEAQLPVSSQTKFQLGSVGKLLTAIAVLQQVEKRQLDLEVNIEKYIVGLNLEVNSDQQVSLKCLLSHSCGFNDINIGYMARDMETILPLEEYIMKSNPGLFQSPGIDINYSNYSYALAGLIVEKITNSNFKEYVSRNIFQPLAMNNSSLDFPLGYEKENDYANAYTKTETGFEQVMIYPRHATPAGSLVSTAEDMGKFIKALYMEDSKLLSKDSWNYLYSQQFKNHNLLNGYSLGFEHQNINGVEAWAKGGMLPGMLTGMLIVPGEFAFFSVVNTSDDEFGEYFYKELFNAFQPNTAAPRPVNSSLSVAKYAGAYRDKRYNHNSVENIVSLFRGAFNIYTNASYDTLSAHHNGKFQDYIPIEEGVFQNTELPYEYFVFHEDDQGQITLYRNINIGGLSVPGSYEKTQWYNSPSFINEFYGFVPIFIFSGILFMIASLLTRLIRTRKKDFFSKGLLPVPFHLLLSAIVILTLIHTFMGPFFLFRNVNEFLFGYPSSFKIVSALGYLLIPLAIGLLFLIYKAWKENWGNLFTRFYTSTLSLALIIHIAFLFYWDFL